NQPLAELVGGHLVAEVPRRAVKAEADADHIARILDNLIRNGLTYSRDEPQVRVALNGGIRPRIMVEDNGLGIPAEYRDRIFERFLYPGLGNVANWHGAASGTLVGTAVGVTVYADVCSGTVDRLGKQIAAQERPDFRTRADEGRFDGGVVDQRHFQVGADRA